MQTVLITGAGWTVDAIDVETDGLAALSQAGCETARMDVTDSETIDTVTARIAAEAGGIDCLVTNAGYAKLGPIEDLPVERMQAQFEVSVWGAIRCIRAALTRMRDQGGETIVTLGSVQGRVASPGWGTYAASKHALTGCHDAIRECPGVDVVLVEPAWVPTDFATRRIHSIATAAHPRARYRIGLPAPLVVLTRWLPASIRDRVQRSLVRQFAEVRR